MHSALKVKRHRKQSLLDRLVCSEILKPPQKNNYLKTFLKRKINTAEISQKVDEVGITSQQVPRNKTKFTKWLQRVQWKLTLTALLFKKKDSPLKKFLKKIGSLKLEQGTFS